MQIHTHPYAQTHECAILENSLSYVSNNMIDIATYISSPNNTIQNISFCLLH